MALKRKKKYSYNLYSKLVGCFTKSGKKNRSEDIIHKSLQSAAQLTGISCFDILNIINDQLTLQLDLKKLTMGNRLVIIPIPVNTDRQSYLVVKRILGGFFNNNLHIKLKDKIAQEYISILQEDSKALADKLNTLRTIKKNKANTHFRW